MIHMIVQEMEQGASMGIGVKVIRFFGRILQFYQFFVKDHQ